MTIIRIPKTSQRYIAPVAPAERSSNDPELQRRMDRIAENYRQLDDMLGEIEEKIQADERLRSIDDSITEIDLTVDGRRRRWRPRRSRASESSATRKPGKPR